jgi:hypothetical protein
MGVGGAQGLPGAGGNRPQQGNVPQKPPYVAPWETDPLSQSAFAQANKTFGNTQAYIASNREGLERHYGFDANGQASPYSLASQLQRRHDSERRGAINGAGLSLYSGSTVNHLRGADFRYAQDEAGLKEQYASELAKLSRQEQEAEEAKEGAYQEGREGAIDRLGEEELPVTPGKGKKKQGGQRGGGQHRPKPPPKHNGGKKKRR